MCSVDTTEDERKVVFVALATMDEYEHGTGGFKGGEYYVSASMDWALRQLDFTVDTMSNPRWFWTKKGLPSSSQQHQHKYRRIFFNTPSSYGNGWSLFDSGVLLQIKAAQLLALVLSSCKYEQQRRQISS